MKCLKLLGCQRIKTAANIEQAQRGSDWTGLTIRFELKAVYTVFEKWMYVIRNLNKLDRVPDELREGIFERLFEVAEIAKFSPEEVQAYEESLKSYRDLKNSLDTAFEDGIEQGEIRKEISFVLRLKNKDKSVTDISDLTGLSEERVKEIIQNEG